MHVGPLAESRCLGLCDHDLAGFYARNKGRRRRAPRNGEGWHFITPSYQKRFPTLRAPHKTVCNFIWLWRSISIKLLMPGPVIVS